MTKEQAYERLELPVGTYLQTVRATFSTMFNQCRMQIDNALSENSKRMAEQKLEEIKEAYVVLNESDGIDDNADLPRIGKSYEEGHFPEKGSGETLEASWNLDQALELFGLTAIQDASTIERTVEQYLYDLQQQLSASNLPAVQQGYRQEIVRAESAKTMVLTWLGTRQQKQQISSETASESKSEAKPQTDKASLPPKQKQPVWGYLLIGVLVIAGLGYFLLKSDNYQSVTLTEVTTDTNATQDSATWRTALAANNEAAYKHYLDEFPEGIFGKEALDSLNNFSSVQKTEQIATEEPKKNTNWRQKYARVDGFNDGLARVRANMMEGYVDKNGNEVVPLKYDMVYDFKNGLGLVQLNGKYGVVNKTGKEIVPPKYHIHSPYGVTWTDGLLAVSIDGKWGYIDKAGKEVIPLKYDNTLFFSEGYASVELNHYYGFIDKHDNVIIPIEYDGISHFKEGLAPVERGGKKGYIDKNNNVVIPFQYTFADSFSNGIARVSTNNSRSFFYINKQGECVKDCPG